jgi:hypothetical protein
MDRQLLVQERERGVIWSERFPTQFGALPADPEPVMIGVVVPAPSGIFRLSAPETRTAGTETAFPAPALIQLVVGVGAERLRAETITSSPPDDGRSSQRRAACTRNDCHEQYSLHSNPSGSRDGSAGCSVVAGGGLPIAGAIGPI